jgi:hypothetical protein
VEFCMKKDLRSNLVTYQTKTGAIELRGDFDAANLWATQSQIAQIFNIDRTVATKHIGNIFKNKEIDRKSNVQKMHIANSDKPVAVYSLDMVLAVGYRANSARAIQFRKWATETIKGFVVDGYAINKNRIAKNYNQFMEAVQDLKQLLPAGSAVDTDSVLELISMFADTWFSLDAYDKESFSTKGLTKKKVALTADKLIKDIAQLKEVLIQKGETTDLFAAERGQGSVAGIVGNVMQSFGGRDLYETVEEKAVHLLYFMIKNHPFVDGNKRSGAYSFVWFLQKAKALDVRRITPPALTALTLLVAESNPKDKDKIIKLLLTLIKAH